MGRNVFGGHFTGISWAVFNFIVRALLLPGLRDTQCGFKCFRRDVARRPFSAIHRRLELRPEILYMARQKNYRIAELPVSLVLRGEKQDKSGPRQLAHC